MDTDISVAQINASGYAYQGRTRVRGLLVMPGASAGTVTLNDGNVLGADKMAISTVAGGEPFSVVIPASGVLFSTGPYVTVSNATTLVFYG